MLVLLMLVVLVVLGMLVLLMLVVLVVLVLVVLVSLVLMVLTLVVLSMVLLVVVLFFLFLSTLVTTLQRSSHNDKNQLYSLHDTLHHTTHHPTHHAIPHTTLSHTANTPHYLTQPTHYPTCHPTHYTQPTLLQWIENTTKLFNSDKRSCLWLLEALTTDHWWVQQILIRCPNQTIRQVRACGWGWGRRKFLYMWK